MKTWQVWAGARVGQTVHIFQAAYQREQRERSRADQLRELAAGMVGDLEMPVLVKRIVETIAEVVGAEASSLYLIDSDKRTLKIQAATGYQKRLATDELPYDLYRKGVAPWIAREGKAFKANNIQELYARPHEFRHLADIPVSGPSQALLHGCRVLQYQTGVHE
ncbi:MAG: hypothetical protein GY862_10235 [Gammaproteobacteria bacterium]|nr:hypothetical protein [Gammaproteobacteria bacterium]